LFTRVEIGHIRISLDGNGRIFLNVSREEAFYSLEHLYELRALTQNPNMMPRPGVAAKGILLMRAVRD